MLTEEYFMKHYVEIKPWEASTVLMTTIDWINKIYTAEYQEEKDPRILVSWELWDAKDDTVLVGDQYPIVSSTFKIVDLEFKITGYHPRYSVPQSRWIYDIVAEKI